MALYCLSVHGTWYRLQHRSLQIRLPRKTSTGLGLSIAKELVSRMDGEIEAKIEKKEFIVEMNFPIVTDAK